MPRPEFFLIIPVDQTKKPSVHTRQEVEDEGINLILNREQGPDDALYRILWAGGLQRVILEEPRPKWTITDKPPGPVHRGHPEQV